MKRTPSTSATRSFSSIGTPASGPAAAAAWPSARSNIGVTTALSVGLSASMRSIAASTSSDAVTSPRATNSACAIPSNSARSVIRCTAWFIVAKWTSPSTSIRGLGRPTRSRVPRNSGLTTNASWVGRSGHES